MSSLFTGQFSPIPGGGQLLAVTNGAPAALTVPDNAKYALIQAIGKTVNWRDDDIDPTNAAGGGMLMAVGAEPQGFFGNLRTVKFISTDVAGSTLVVYYYG